ncbi:MAG: ABC-F family ATP-binding cassette domain-containing protein [Proteobacteria bacterium]|nr:ABC-F family ATP-binding cassette domain-containing protein [Pseudomonadota bacterium]
MLLTLDQVEKRIGPRTLFSGVSLQIRAGDRIGLVGPNGAGKTTLLRIAAGDEGLDGGRVMTSRNVRIGMLKQEIDPRLEHSVREEAARALARLAELELELRELEGKMERAGRDGREVPADVAERYDQAHAAFLHGGGFEREARVEAVLEGLGFDEAARGRPLSSFSGGWLMRVELGKLLLSEPDVLLLDEPTNHLDLPAIQWFESTLEDFAGGVVVVSHDRTYLRRHARRIAELDARGRFEVYEGGYESYLEQRAARREELLARKRNQDRQIAHMQGFVDRFRYKAKKARMAQSRLKAIERIERVEVDTGGPRRMRLRIPAPPRAGEVVMALDDVYKRYGETVVYEGIELEVRRGDRMALVGPNGAGKSTLLRILAGALDFERGERRPGHNVRVAFYAQHQLEVLDPERTVLEELAAGGRTGDVPRLRGHLGAFLFSGDDVEKKVAILSGGEKARLALAKLLLHPANLLVLDEPTNHLDIQACEVLEEALRAYQGTLVFITHDRSFINTLANKVVEVKSGVLREFLGNYDDYLRRTGGGDTAPATPQPQPHTERAKAADAPPTGPVPAGPVRKKAHRQERERRKAEERTGRKIERLEGEILEREREVESLGWRLGDPEIYRDPEQVQTIKARRGELQGEIAELYRDWERLADELEALRDGAD